MCNIFEAPKLGEWGLQITSYESLGQSFHYSCLPFQPILPLSLFVVVDRITVLGMANSAAIIKQAKERIIVEKRDVPGPQASEILVKNRAVAVNPVDWKVQSSGHFITKYPIVLGSDICGTVEAVGSDVKHFKEGDRVTGFAAVLASSNIDEGAFQQYTILRENCAARIPENLSFVEGATLPMAVATAGVGMWEKLGIAKPTESKQSGGFLVWGAASSVGSAVLQMAASLGFTVFAICSSHNHEEARKLGAAEVFDYNAGDVARHVISRAESAKTPIRYAFDAVSVPSSIPQAAAILEGFGGGKLCRTLPSPEDPRLPKSVEVVTTSAYDVAASSHDFGRWLFNDWLEGVLQDKSYKISPAIEIVEGGIESVQKAFDVHKQGVSGKKLVLPLA